MNKNTTYDPNVVNTLYSAFGAQLLRVREDKAPAESRGWIDRQLSLDDLLEHVESDGLLGLIPASVGLVAVDVDEGDAARLLSDFPPACAYRTRRTNGIHAFYPHDGPPIPQRRWHAPIFRTSGDLRHARGYVVLWNAERLTEDLSRGSGGLPFAEVRQALVTRPPAPQGRQATPKLPPDGTEPTPDDSPPSPFHLRHEYLKDKLKAARTDGMQGPALRQYAVFLHGQLIQPPDPRVSHRFELSEALSLASWAARWSWDSSSQRAKGRRSGQVRRDRNADRDQRIVVMLGAGMSQRETARTLGVSRGTVEQVKRRELAGDGDKSH